jgi:TonB family protein
MRVLLKLSPFVVASLVKVTSYAQSAKKLNAQLRNEFTWQQKNYDSVYSAYQQVQVKYARQTKLIRERYDENRTHTTNFDRKKSIANSHYQDLQKLKLEAPYKRNMDSLTRLSVTYKLTTHRAVYRELENKYVRTKLTWDLEEGAQYATKEQNIWIDGINQQIWEATVDLLSDQREMYRLMDSIPGVMQELDQILQANRSKSIFAGLVFNEMDNRLRQLRIEFNEKGAENFPPEYRQLFQGISESMPMSEVVESPVQKRPDENVVYEVVEDDPGYPGGFEALKKFLAQNVVYPPVALEKGIQGKCIVQFTISETGVPSNFVVKWGVPDCPECDEEAIRVLKLMPNWIPGKRNGKPAITYYSLPVKFYVSE